ncbi:phosphoglycerate dehydrogenase [Erysipelothrix sp. HDW6C]|uniref:phosphoglycerate dehydrogenase n=1 Tax=Erysipelothrix sp. HDW6C TaxID=2714930 RepID=UPI001408D5BD|nr:phosphoglycerate dehydrogenase [Erysipelothrix sp. HDW6C]QIK69432.1 phosphoglycerate dehydrogenase [Erysipelothrix sp. HDW6C]
MKVLITPRGFHKVGQTYVKLMEDHGLTVHYNDTGLAYTHEEFIALAHDADAIIVGVDRMDREMMSQCPNLRVICKFGVGTDNIDLDYARESGIHVGRTVGSNSRSVAEHVMALMFAESKNIYPVVRDVKAHKWEKPTGYELAQKTLGIVGFGAIGKHLATIANGIGMNVVAYDAFDIPNETATSYQTSVVSFDTLIATSDYISLHVPLTDETANMFSEKTFNQMKNTASIINAARGGIVDEDALYRALVNRDIRAACFDVFSIEPPSHDEKLLELDNFLLTPHTASRTVESELRTCEMSSQIVMEHLGVEVKHG